MKQILVTVSEFCRLVGVKRTTAFALIRDQRVDSLKLGSKRLITVSSIEQLVQQLLEAAEPPENGTDARSVTGDA